MTKNRAAEAAIRSSSPSSSAQDKPDPGKSKAPLHEALLAADTLATSLEDSGKEVPPNLQDLRQTLSLRSVMRYALPYLRRVELNLDFLWSSKKAQEGLYQIEGREKPLQIVLIEIETDLVRAYLAMTTRRMQKKREPKGWLDALRSIEDRIHEVQEARLQVVNFNLRRRSPSLKLAELRGSLDQLTRVVRSWAPPGVVRPDSSAQASAPPQPAPAVEASVGDAAGEDAVQPFDAADLVVATAHEVAPAADRHAAPKPPSEGSELEKTRADLEACRAWLANKESTDGLDEYESRMVPRLGEATNLVGDRAYAGFVKPIQAVAGLVSDAARASADDGTWKHRISRAKEVLSELRLYEDWKSEALGRPTTVKEADEALMFMARQQNKEALLRFGGYTELTRPQKALAWHEAGWTIEQVLSLKIQGIFGPMLTAAKNFRIGDVGRTLQVQSISWEKLADAARRVNKNAQLQKMMHQGASLTGPSGSGTPTENEHLSRVADVQKVAKLLPAAGAGATGIASAHGLRIDGQLADFERAVSAKQAATHNAALSSGQAGEVRARFEHFQGLSETTAAAGVIASSGLGVLSGLLTLSGQITETAVHDEQMTQENQARALRVEAFLKRYVEIQITLSELGTKAANIMHSGARIATAVAKPADGASKLGSAHAVIGVAGAASGALSILTGVLTMVQGAGEWKDAAVKGGRSTALLEGLKKIEPALREKVSDFGKSVAALRYHRMAERIGQDVMRQSATKGVAAGLHVFAGAAAITGGVLVAASIPSGPAAPIVLAVAAIVGGLAGVAAILSSKIGDQQLSERIIAILIIGPSGQVSQLRDRLSTDLDPLDFYMMQLGYVPGQYAELAKDFRHAFAELTQALAGPETRGARPPSDDPWVKEARLVVDTFDGYGHGGGPVTAAGLARNLGP